MAEIIYLQPGQQMPEFGEGQSWLTVEASDDNRYYGTGFGRRVTGEGVFYISLPESDPSLDLALETAKQWAAKYQVARIWIRAMPD